MAEERKEMVRVMNEIVEGWQEMEGKDRWYVQWIRHVRMERYEGKWRGCIESDWIE